MADSEEEEIDCLCDDSEVCLFFVLYLFDLYLVQWWSDLLRWMSNMGAPSVQGLPQATVRGYSTLLS